MQRMHKPAISNRLLLAMAMSERELRLQGFQRMRALLIVLMLVSSASTYGAAPAIAQLSWISGCWKTEKSEAGTGEHWTTPAGGAMLGVSRTIRLGKLVEYEFMQFRTTAYWHSSRSLPGVRPPHFVSSPWMATALCSRTCSMTFRSA
jgi:hypothetical protein